jgi:hypothetical protein
MTECNASIHTNIIMFCMNYVWSSKNWMNIRKERSLLAFFEISTLIENNSPCLGIYKRIKTPYPTLKLVGVFNIGN